MRARTLVWAVLLVAAACAPGRGSGIDPAAPPADGRVGPVYVAVGASETAGFGADVALREAWPRILYREAMPPETVFVNLGLPGATVAEALQRSVDHAVELAPDVATVWLNVNDLLAAVPPTDYGRQLDTLVGRLRRGGATRLLVANTPPLDHLPSYLACRPDPPAGGPACRAGAELPPPDLINAAVDAYNVVIASVARRHGALLVDLHATAMAARAAGTAESLVSDDGFHPSTAGHASVAAAFAAVLAASGPLRAAGG